MILSWSCCSCGTPRSGCIAGLFMVENWMVAVLSVDARDLVISSFRSSIVRISISLNFVRYPLRRVDRQRGILAAGVPGKHDSNLFLCMLLS